MSPCSGHGYKFCSVIGEIAADLVVDGADPPRHRPIPARSVRIGDGLTVTVGADHRLSGAAPASRPLCSRSDRRCGKVGGQTPSDGRCIGIRSRPGSAIVGAPARQATELIHLQSRPSRRVPSNDPAVDRVRRRRAARTGRRTTVSDVVAFIRYCHRCRGATWLELYDEMCAVAARREFNGWDHAQLASRGLTFSLARDAASRRPEPCRPGRHGGAA